MVAERIVCETPGSCQLLGKCCRAIVINREFIYEQQGMKDNALAISVRNARCNHPQVTRVVSKVREFRIQGLRQAT